MPKSAAPKASPVTVRRSPDPDPGATKTQETPDLLLQPVPQIDDPGIYQEMRVWITPDMAKEILAVADRDPEFRQRKIVPPEMRRWRLLMETNRFVHFLPNGVLAFADIDGVEFDKENPATWGLVINGKHRLMASAGTGTTIGMIVYRHVPRWMFAYFDSGKARSLSDAAFTAGMDKLTPAQTRAVRGAMRYEEFVAGQRRPYGWKEWSRSRDEHSDVIAYAKRREPLMDLHIIAAPLARKTGLNQPAVQVFRFFQELAWPDGIDATRQFTQQLLDEEHTTKDPGLALSNWAANEAGSHIVVAPARRELHALMMFRAFCDQMRGVRLHRYSAAPGQPMEMPYHPEGDDAARANIYKQLQILNMEAA